MSKLKTKLLLIAAIVSILAIIFFILMLKIIYINSLCNANPFVYGADYIAKQGVSIRCDCTVHGEKGDLGMFWFDNKNIVMNNAGNPVYSTNESFISSFNFSLST